MITVTEKVTTMTCNDCSNQTDSKCCHQLSEPSVTDWDEVAFVREMQHSFLMQKRNQGR